MSISTKLSSDQMLARVSQISEEIQLRQTKISTGREITEAAEKPLEAVKLSALEEGLTLLGGFEKNVGVAQSRLSLGDTVLKSVDEYFGRLNEIAVAANNPKSVIDRVALKIEVSNITLVAFGMSARLPSPACQSFPGISDRQADGRQPTA